MSQLAGRVINAALAGELTDHLGYPPGQAPPGGVGNMRNGSTAKTVATDLGPVAVNIPRDRQGSFEVEWVAKRQTCLASLDERILGLYAGGLSVRDISAHLCELYGTEIGRDTISRITAPSWRTSRPGSPSRGGAVSDVYFDALMVKVTEDRSVKTGACYLAVGVSLENEREILGLWWQETEGAKFWLAVLNDLPARRQGRLDRVRRRSGGLPRTGRRGLPRDFGADVHRAHQPIRLTHRRSDSLRKASRCPCLIDRDIPGGRPPCQSVRVGQDCLEPYRTLKLRRTEAEVPLAGLATISTV
jgi:transposase-like protein